VRQQREGERKDKYNASSASTRQRHGPGRGAHAPDFTKLTPLYPQDRLGSRPSRASSPPASSTW
jgi:hypothetical protein